jgi:hypothetical protein
MLTRDIAINMVKKHEGSFPLTYLGKSTNDILRDIDINLEEFELICDKFTNKELFETDSDGNLIKDKDGNLSKRYILH